MISKALPVRTTLRPAFTALLMACTSATMVALGSASPAAAQNLRSYAIPAGPLADALNSLAEQSGAQILYDAALADGRRTEGLNGSFSTAGALSRLLDGSGLTFRQSGARTYTLERAPQAAEGTVQLGTLRVGGAGDGGGTGARGGDGIAKEWAGAADQPWRAPVSSEHRSMAQIERFRGTTIGDVVAGIPGVHAGENRNSGALDLNVRGLQGMNRVPVVVDGAQQSTVTYRGYSGVASRNYLDPDLLGEMVIEKGPSTRPEAVGATGGIMVARTIAAQDLIEPGETFGVRIRGGLQSNTVSPPAAGTPGGLQTDALNPFNYGQDSRGWLQSCTPSPTATNPNFCNSQVIDGPIPDAAFSQSLPPGKRPGLVEPSGGNLSVAAAKNWGDFDLVGAIAWRKAGNYFAGTHGPGGYITTERREIVSRNGTLVFDRPVLAGDTRFRLGEQVVNSAFENLSFLVKGTIRLDGGHSLELGYNRFDSDYGDMMPSEIVRGEGFKQGVASNVKVDTYTARYRFDPASDLINLRVNAWRKELRMERNLYYGLLEWMAGMTGSDPVFLPAAHEFSKRTGLDADNTSIFNLFGGKMELRYGASYTWEDLASAPFPELATGEYSLDLTTDKHDGWRREASAFVSSEYSPTDWLRIDAALRYVWSHSYDRNLTRYSYRDENRQTVFGPWVNYELKTDGIAPIFAVNLEPLKGLRLYARYAEAIRTPSLFESTVGFSSGIDPRYGIKPERMRGREVGLNYEGALFGKDMLRVHAAYFDNRVSDYLTRGGNWGGQTSNLDYAEFQGVEVRAEYDRGWVYGSIGGMYYTHLNYCDYPEEDGTRTCYPSGVGFSDRQIPPEKSASGQLGVRLFQERLDLGTRVIYNGRRPDMTFVGSGSVNVRWSPSTVVDVYAGFALDERLSIDFKIDNLTDQYYADPLMIGITAAPGRTARLGFTAKF